MKTLRILGLLIAVAASLLSVPAFASAAPTLTSPAGTEYTGTMEATMTAGTSSVFKAGIEDTCTSSSVSGPVTGNTEIHVTISITIETRGCTKDTVVIISGSLTISSSGAVTASGNEVTVNDTGLGISCVYGGGTGTVIGTLTPGTPAKLAVNTTKLKKISGGFFCSSEGTWTSNYTVTKPSTLLLS